MPLQPVAEILDGSALERVAALQTAIVSSLPSGFIYSKSEAELNSFLNGTRGVVFGLLDDSELLAYAMLSVPSAAYPNTNLPFRLVHVTEWKSDTCFFENSMVAPLYRGRGYQHRLIDLRIAYAADVGMKWLCCGVRLQNVRSLRNVLATGFAIADSRDDRGYQTIGLLRQATRPLQTDRQASCRVELEDFDNHQRALRRGYVGVRLDNDTVTYEKLMDAETKPLADIRE